MTVVNERRFSRRSPSQAQGRHVSGYAALFNTPADIGGQFVESIKPEAFNRALKDKHDVRLLVNHNPDSLLSRTTNGSLTLAADSVGLRFRAQIPDTQAGNDLLTLLRSHTMSQCSFGFSVPSGGDTWSKRLHQGVTRDFREINDCDLLDVSCVTYPAYSATSADIDDEDEEDCNLLAMAAVASRGNVPAEVRSRIARAVAAGPQTDIARRMEELAAELEADKTLAPDYVARRMAQIQAHRLLEGLD